MICIRKIYHADYDVAKVLAENKSRLVHRSYSINRIQRCSTKSTSYMVSLQTLLGGGGGRSLLYVSSVSDEVMPYGTQLWYDTTMRFYSQDRSDQNYLGTTATVYFVKKCRRLRELVLYRMSYTHREFGWGGLQDIRIIAWDLILRFHLLLNCRWKKDAGLPTCARILNVKSLMELYITAWKKTTSRTILTIFRTGLCISQHGTKSLTVNGLENRLFSSSNNIQVFSVQRTVNSLAKS